MTGPLAPARGLRPPCPCGSGTPYDACCGRLHRGAAQAETAVELMRSRYAAYAVGDTDYVWRTWHPRTRPTTVTDDQTVAWTGLTLLDVAEHEVEFEAAFVRDGQRGTLHERSTFEQRAGRWVYVGPVAGPTASATRA